MLWDSTLLLGFSIGGRIRIHVDIVLHRFCQQFVWVHWGKRLAFIMILLVVIGMTHI